jgi:hypothetical protein
MAGINYLFPPDQVLNLPTWRFVLHFEVSPAYRDEHRQQAITALKAAQWKIVTFPFGLDTLVLDEAGRALSVPIEVSEDRRRRPNSLADYESDVWKVMGNVMCDGFGEAYYEAVDWRE